MFKKIRDRKGRFVKGHPGNINLGRGQFKKGHPGYNKKPNSGSFKKGEPNINRGKKGLWGLNKGSFHKGHVPWMKGRFREKASNWKGGRTAIFEAIRKSRKYATWRLSVYKKDNFICQLCGKRGGVTKLEAHHSKPFIKILEANNINTTEEAIKCEELWDINNGFTLCNQCHNLNKKRKL